MKQQNKVKFLCISDGLSSCLCAMRGCKRLAKISDEDIIKLIDLGENYETTIKK